MTANDIVQIVYEVCGVSIEELHSTSIERRVTMARHFTIFYLYHQLNMPVYKISTLLHLKSKSSVYRLLFDPSHTIRHRVRQSEEWTLKKELIEAKLALVHP